MVAGSAPFTQRLPAPSFLDKASSATRLDDAPPRFASQNIRDCQDPAKTDLSKHSSAIAALLSIRSEPPQRQISLQSVTGTKRGNTPNCPYTCGLPYFFLSRLRLGSFITAWGKKKKNYNHPTQRHQSPSMDNAAGIKIRPKKNKNGSLWCMLAASLPGTPWTLMMAVKPQISQ